MPFHIASQVVPSSLDAFSLGCLMGNNSGFFLNLVIIDLQPILLLAGAVAAWAIIFKLKHQQIYKNSEFKKKILLTIGSIMYVLYPGILKAKLELFE
jgi:hypothetical protein